jgi:ADP-ribose pyrophosphatase
MANAGDGHWELMRTEEGPALRIFTARFDTFLHPVKGLPLRATVLTTPPWCNVIALTQDNQMVLVRQFRFGVREVTLEVPGGMVDPGEDHEAAVKRELQEETGYTSDDWTYLGACQQNPAFHDELCHMWLAKDARPSHDHIDKRQHDSTEHIHVELMAPAAVVQAVHDGGFQHPHAIVALSRVYDLRLR